MSEITGKHDGEDSDELVAVFVPALRVVLAEREKVKGTPLTEVEVGEITESSVVVIMAEHAALELDRSRGYVDIDPEHPWISWNEFKAEQGGRVS